MVLLHYQLCDSYFWSFHSVHYYSKAGKIYGLVKSISVNSYGMFLMHMLWLPFGYQSFSHKYLLRQLFLLLAYLPLSVVISLQNLSLICLIANGL